MKGKKIQVKANKNPLAAVLRVLMEAGLVSFNTGHSRWKSNDLGEGDDTWLINGNLMTTRPQVNL